MEYMNYCNRDTPNNNSEKLEKLEKLETPQIINLKFSKINLKKLNFFFEQINCFLAILIDKKPLSLLEIILLIL